MAITDCKILSSDVNPVHVQGIAEDVLTGTVAQNKKVFDNYCDMIVTKFNAFVDVVAQDTTSEIDSEVIAQFVAAGWTQPTVASEEGE